MKKTMFNFMLALLPAMVFATSPAMAGDSKDLVNGYSENPSVAAYSSRCVLSDPCGFWERIKPDNEKRNG